MAPVRSVLRTIRLLVLSVPIQSELSNWARAPPMVPRMTSAAPIATTRDAVDQRAPANAPSANPKKSSEGYVIAGLRRASWLNLIVGLIVRPGRIWPLRDPRPHFRRWKSATYRFVLQRKVSIAAPAAVIVFAADFPRVGVADGQFASRNS